MVHPVVVTVHVMVAIVAEATAPLVAKQVPTAVDMVAEATAVAKMHHAIVAILAMVQLLYQVRT